MDEVLEALQYLFSFWRFVFSKRFRAECISKFKRMSLFRKCMEIAGGLASTFVGLGLLVFIVYWVFFTTSISASIDACLDGGGSFNHQLCECDYELSHPYIEKNQCE
tara:strand:+ start:700 stop:1020 length:321 start_codon:yes stop_codon:yes gene_type:complete